MGPALSTYLNILRFGAALVVLVSHFAYPRFSDGAWLWLRDLNLGSDAVVVFFVLSGFVIALTAARKDATLGAYLFARTTRILSVALPALVLGWGLDRWGSSLAPQEYYAPFYTPLPLWETLLRGLTFSNEWSGMAQRLGSNGPYWSLSYEVAYYLMFGFAVFLKGPRRVLFLLAGLALFGLNVLLLMPAWMMGVWLFHRLERGWSAGPRAALALAGLPVLAYGAALAFGLPQWIAAHVQPGLGSHALRFSDEYLWNAILGALVCLHLAGMACLLKSRPTPRLSAQWGWLAGASFSIYLIHYPLLQFLHAALPAAGHAMLLVTTLAACFIFAELFERPLHLWRNALRRGLGKPAPAQNPAQNPARESA